MGHDPYTLTEGFETIEQNCGILKCTAMSEDSTEDVIQEAEQLNDQIVMSIQILQNKFYQSTKRIDFLYL